MYVDRVSACLKYSRQLAEGQYKTVELGAEAAIQPDEDWQKAQNELYQQLVAQLRTLFKGGSHASN